MCINMAGHLDFVAAQGVDVIDPAQVAALYDALLGAWLGTPENERPDPNEFINVVGTAFGEHLVRTTPMRWRVATDGYGTELAVHDESSAALVYPANAVGKRWAERQAGDFIPGISANVTAALRDRPAAG